MDSFFKAAVCDLDKLLDDFELNTEELDCRSVYLKPSSFPFSSQASSVPNLSSLHYGSAPGCSAASDHDGEVRGRPLTGVDLLSSVDRRPETSSAPPCPDRALKPVCDLVNDTGSAILARADSHDAFSELDAAEKKMEEEGAERQEEEDGAELEQEVALLVDFDSPVVTEQLSHGGGGEDVRNGGFAASLSLLDVILPAAAERSCEVETEEAEQPQTEELEVAEEMAAITASTSESKDDASPQEDLDKNDAESPASDGETTALSCLPMAASICGALVKPKVTEVESRDDDGGDCEVESTEADAMSVPEDAENTETQAPEGQQVAPDSDHAHSDHVQSEPEFGFEFLPESDQAELLVTDEELDAFLQAHGGGGVPSEHDDEDDEVTHDEPRVCGGSCHDNLDGLASPESDRIMMCVTAAGNSNQPRDSNISPSSSGGGVISDLPPSYGGARPKQLHCQTVSVRTPPAGGNDGEEEEGAEPSPAAPQQEEDSVPVSPSPSEEPGPAYSPEEQDQDYGYDELSEPPPYPGEPTPPDGAGTASWRREGGGELGSRQPQWVPDSEAPNCMNCYQRFTFTKRRHHCRACGKVYCAVCCNRKCKLKYLDKEARVCVVCFDAIHRAQALERMMSPTGPSPNPNVPSEYCSTIPPLQQARAAGTLNSPPPTVMVPVSVLKHPNNDGCPREQKRVWFADGILPNGEVADTTRLSVTSRRSSQEFSSAPSPDQTPSPGPPGSEVSVGGERCSAPEASGAAEVAVVRPPVSGPWDYALLAGLGSSVKRLHSLMPDNEDELPPLLIVTGDDDGGGDVLVEESPAPCQILHLLEEGGPRPLSFVLNVNLLVNVKLVTYSGRRCWCFGSNGLQALGQRELVFVLECLPEEKTLPRDLFTLYLSVYQDAQKGKFVEDLDNVTFTSSFLGSKDHGGVLFFSPSCQPLDGLALPPPPFLFGVLVQKLEVPWAKVFPLRLLLRLGAEYDVYPTALISVRFRDSVYRETGHTIMNLLADLRNYQYSLSVVDGLRIHMEMGHSYIDIPKTSFNEMQKVVNSSNEHVISVGATFSSEADSHLVCFQNDDGNYQTQANSKPGETRTVTGASFVVFNGALKASSGFIAKSSIVEDGLMVQIPPDTMESLRTALREQNDFLIPCGKNDGGELRENVTVRWVDWRSHLNTGKTSGVDGRSLDGVRSVRMQQDADFKSDGRSIACTEVFYQLKSPDVSLASVLSSCAVFQKEMAVATCGALTPHLSVLAAAGINSVSLRVSTQDDMVEYQAGGGGRLLPQRYMNELDGALIPVIHGGSAGVPQTAMDMEFIFYITHTI